MENQIRQSDADQTAQGVATERPVYEAPRVTVLDEADVLKTFQFTSAAISWWVA